jgi:hypothetical protein
MPELLADVTIPVCIVSESNMREHWAPKAARAKKHRRAAFYCVLALFGVGAEFPGRYRVLLTRWGPKTLDGDNLQGGFKATRDGIAQAMGIDDGSGRWVWEYGQEVATVYAARVQIWRIE